MKWIGKCLPYKIFLNFCFLFSYLSKVIFAPVKNEKSSTNNVNLFFLASIKNGSAKKDLYSF